MRICLCGLFVYIFGQQPTENVILSVPGQIIEHEIEYAAPVEVGIKQREIKATKEIPVCILTAAAAQRNLWHGTYIGGFDRG